MKSLNWFYKQIGKRIYRDLGSCGCPTCNYNFRFGLIVYDEMHARYIYDTQNDLANEGEYLHYRSKKRITGLTRLFNRLIKNL